MKKVSLVVMERERESALEKLRDVGLVHLERKNVSSDAMVELHEKRVDIRQALGILLRYTPKKKSKGKVQAPIPEVPYRQPEMAGAILEMADEKDMLQEQLANLLGERRRVESWGDFEPFDFHYLNKHGAKMYLYALPVQALGRIGKGTEYIVLSRDKQWVKVASIGAEIPGMNHFVLPDHSLSRIDDMIEATRDRIDEIVIEFTKLAFHKKTLEAESSRLLEEIEYETAKAGMDILEDEPTGIAITWLSGFIPDEKISVLEKAALDNGWTLTWNDPSLSDNPPTILKNKPALRIIQPLFSMLGTLPGYWEYDISMSYMVFLCFFFAMIFGDAGYGLLLFAIGLVLGLLNKKKGGDFPDAAKLVMVLSLSAVVWGGLTGSWFAIPAAKLPRILQLCIIPPYNNAGPLAEFPRILQKIFGLPAVVPVDELKTQWNIQFLCFTVGMIQLVFARFKNIKKLLPSLAAIGQFGWLAAMIGVYFVVLSVLLKMMLPPFAVWFIISGVGLNLIFSEQKHPITGILDFLKGVMRSFSNFFNIFLKAVGCFADIISYIRLFAVGMAGSMIAATFNSMAIPAEGFGGFGLNFILRLLMAVLVLIFGHALNLLMNTLSLIIHGIRLNLLEYAGNHLGMDWSGYTYKPFALRQKRTTSEEEKVDEFNHG